MTGGGRNLLQDFEFIGCPQAASISGSVDNRFVRWTVIGTEALQGLNSKDLASTLIALGVKPEAPAELIRQLLDELRVAKDHSAAVLAVEKSALARAGFIAASVAKATDALYKVATSELAGQLLSMLGFPAGPSTPPIAS